jgi:hypothetical protein
MAHRLKTAEGKKLYAQRKYTPEPAFGIIKSAMGFRQFLLRGRDNVKSDWRCGKRQHNSHCYANSSDKTDDILVAPQDLPKRNQVDRVSPVNCRGIFRKHWPSTADSN